MKDFKWEPRYTAYAVYTFLVAAAVILFGALVYKFDVVWGFLNSIVQYLIPFVYGFGMAFILNPLLRFYERIIHPRKISGKFRRTLSLLATYLSALTLLVIFFLVIIPALAESIGTLAKNITIYTAQIDKAFNDILKLIPMEVVPKEVISAIDQMLTTVTSFVVSSLLKAVSITGQVTTGVIDVIMGIIISLSMLANKEMLAAQLKKMLNALLPTRFVHKLIDVAHDSNAKFSGFLVGKIIDSIIIGILCALGMWIFRMPFIPLVSLIIGVTNIIPYFGPFIGAVPGIILVLIGGGFGPALGFAVFILVLQQFDGNILGPAILGQSTGLDAMWVIFAILLFGGLYGFVGMIIGVPLLAVIFGLCTEFLNTRLQKKGLPVETEEYASEQHQLLTTKRQK
ncbi:MAG: AI-2E family transporter [Angelakisella sp.]